MSPIQSPGNRDHLILRWKTANVLYLAVTHRFVLDNDIHCDILLVMLLITINVLYLAVTRRFVQDNDISIVTCILVMFLIIIRH